MVESRDIRAINKAQSGTECWAEKRDCIESEFVGCVRTYDCCRFPFSWHTPTLELKTKLPAAAPRNATIYFLRLEGLITPYSPDVKVDGRVVGKMPAGTYFVVSIVPRDITRSA
jgi:hypothetical protein